MSILITPTKLPTAAQNATSADIVLQPGSVISAKVLQLLGNDHVQISIGGQAIDVLSQVPLQAGQTLQLQVSQTADGVGLAVVNQPGGAVANPDINDGAITDSVTLAPDAAALVAISTPPATPATGNQLTALESLAVSVAAQTAAAEQASLAPLFANLDAVAGSPSLSPQLQQAVTQVLAQRTTLDQNLTGNDIKQAFQTSGLFLEATLASGSVPSSASAPDLKAALIVLRQVLTTSLAGISEAVPGTAAVTTIIPSATVAVATQNAATSAVTQQSATATAAATTTAATAAVLAAQTGQVPSIVIAGQTPQSAVEALAQPITILAASGAPAVPSPSIAQLIATGAPASAAPPPTPSAAGAQPTLDLSVANQIASAATTPTDAAARAAASSAALNLLQEALQAGPLAAVNSSRFVVENGQLLALLPAVAGSRTVPSDDEFVRNTLPPPPISGGLPTAQPVMAATLVAHAPVEATLHHLLTDTDGAIARQTLLQVASLPGQPDAGTTRSDPTAPRWNFEIPFLTPQGTAMAQFEISRDGSGREVEAAKQVWRARFSLNVEPAGPIHALVSLNGQKTSVRMWAERPSTAAELRAGVSQLSQALSRAELQPGDIVVRDGAPVQPATAPAGHFLDRAL
jgi:hypothetical protein